MHRSINSVNIGTRIKVALKFAGLKQKQASSLLGISENSMVAYIKGRTTPALPTIIAISTITKVDINWLRSGEGNFPSQQFVIHEDCPVCSALRLALLSSVSFIINEIVIDRSVINFCTACGNKL